MHWLYPNSQPDLGTFDQCVERLNSQLNGQLFFVEVGAMDGIKHDSLYSHIIGHPTWSGILIEPLPDMFEKLKNNYHNRENLIFENSAIAAQDGDAKITRIPAEKVNNGCPDWSDGISTLRPDIHIIGHYEYLKSHSVAQSIKTSTFRTIMNKHQITRIDLLQIDVEGLDKEVFDQIWEAGFRPGIIKLEISYLLYVVIRDLKFMLEEAGYKCFFEADDIIAVKQ